MAFDGIVTKAICSELQQLVGARIDKIYEPNKNNIILGFYIDGKNYALNICTDASNYRLHLTTHSKPNPMVAPNFCMVLRKNLIGLRIKNVITSNLERVVTIEFEGFDDIDDIINKKLIIELMGKHCNIILLDDNGIIIDSLRHIASIDESTRSLIPHIKYKYPTTDKHNFLDTLNYSSFIKKLDITLPCTIDDIAKTISTKFNGISKSFVEFSLKKLNISEITNSTLNDLYEYIKNTINSTDSLNLSFETINDKTGKPKDYILTPGNTNSEKYNPDESYNTEKSNTLNLNFFIDDFYYTKETSQEFKIYRDSILKLILSSLKKYNKRLLNIDQKLKECDNMDTYKLYGELITANLYRIKDNNTDKIELENYYDNNNLISIPLNQKYSPSTNAKLFFKKYNKLKNALKIVSNQKEETIKDLNYIESIIYELENCKNLEDISSVFDEISESPIFKDKTDKLKSKKNHKIKKSNLTKNKNVKFNPIKYTIANYTLLVGRNNIENDYLTLKYAKKTDLWFHTKDIHGSHCILLLNGKSKPANDILIKCAEIAAYHSKAKLSSNVPVDICEVKNVKKPNGAKPGMVIYTNNQTINVQPKK